MYIIKKILINALMNAQHYITFLVLIIKKFVKKMVIFVNKVINIKLLKINVQKHVIQYSSNTQYQNKNTIIVKIL